MNKRPLECRCYFQGDHDGRCGRKVFLGALDVAPSLFGRSTVQKLSCWDPVARFPILSTCQTFFGLAPESSCIDPPLSASPWESLSAALKLGRTPNVAQSVLYRALIWRNNLGMSTSAEWSDSEDDPEGEGLVRGNWAIASSKTLMLCIVRLVQNQRIRIASGIGVTVKHTNSSDLPVDS